MKIDTWLASLTVDATPDMAECVEMLGGYFDYLHRLEVTEQDEQWHAEGNVYIHTDMVLRELYKLLQGEAGRHITGWRRQALILAAVLHDIAKPIRTRRFLLNGIERVGSPKHEVYGRSYLAFRIQALRSLSFPVRLAILNLVGEHHTPKRLVVRGASKADYLRLARQADTELLYWLEVADMRGRCCPDLQQQLGYLDEFRLFAEEYSVWGTELATREALSAHLAELAESQRDYVYSHALYELESGKIFMAEEALATSYQHRGKHAHLVVICGPSGSGKSQWAKSNHPNYTLVSLDNLREQFNGVRSNQAKKGQILQQAKNELKTALRNKQNVIWDATNLRTDFRSIVCGLGRDYNALVTLVVFLVPEDTLLKNNRKRKHSVPDQVLQSQLSNYQFPLLEEAHQMQFVDEHGRTAYRSGFF